MGCAAVPTSFESEPPYIRGYRWASQYLTHSDLHPETLKLSRLAQSIEYNQPLDPLDVEASHRILPDLHQDLLHYQRTGSYRIYLYSFYDSFTRGCWEAIE